MSTIKYMKNLSAKLNHVFSRNKGFTLIELLVVIGILAVLLAIVLVAINPAKQFAQANNTQRKSDVNAILNAIHQYAADNKGALPAGITTTNQAISNSGANICSLLVPTYIAAMPTDPTAGTTFTSCTTYSTGYQVSRTASGSAGSRVTITAPSAENGEVITVTR